jgi:hypothetical protein
MEIDAWRPRPNRSTRPTGRVSTKADCLTMAISNVVTRPQKSTTRCRRGPNSKGSDLWAWRRREDEVRRESMFCWGRAKGGSASCLVLGAWCLVLGAWCLVLSAWCLVLSAGCGVRGAGCGVRGAGCLVRCAWCVVLSS